MSTALTVNVILLWAVALFNLLLCLAIVKKLNELGPQEYRYKTLERGEKAPGFEAVDLSGKTVTLEDFAGRSVAFVFSSSRCAPCREELPQVEDIAPVARRAGTEIVFVGLDELDEAKMFSQELGLTLPMLVAPLEGNSFKKDYKVAGTPFFCLLDKDHKVEAAAFFSEGWDKIVQRWEAAKPSDFVARA